MSRRVSLPGAAELFRPTRERGGTDAPRADDPRTDDPDAPREGGTGRVRHNEKITVYVSTDELLALEQARLALRAHHATAVDRGRVVREAIAIALADLELRGADSALVQRLTDS